MASLCVSWLRCVCRGFAVCVVQIIATRWLVRPLAFAETVVVPPFVGFVFEPLELPLPLVFWLFSFLFCTFLMITGIMVKV